MTKRIALIVLTLFLLAVPVAADGNLLRNGDFDGPTYLWRGQNEVELPDGWTEFWWRQSKEYDGRPEIKSAVSWGFPDGSNPTLLKAFTTFRQHRYRIGQRVEVHPGAVYRLTARVWCWSSDDDAPWESDDGGSYRSRIGVQDDTGIYWSTPSPGVKAMDRWVVHKVEYTATQSEVVVLIEGDAEWALKHGDAYWDWVRLEMIAPPPDDLEPRIEELESIVVQQTAQIRALETLIQNQGEQLNALLKWARQAP